MYFEVLIPENYTFINDIYEINYEIRVMDITKIGCVYIIYSYSYVNF